MDQSGGEPAQQVEDQEARRPHPILHVVAEDPQCPHVADDVHEAAVEKHARQKRPVVVGRKAGPEGPVGMRIAGRHNSKQIKKLFDPMRGQHQLEEKNARVDKNQRVRNYWHGSARNRVTNWKHLGTQLSHQRHQSAATGDLQLAEDGMKMFFYCFEAQTAFICNLLITAPIAH